MERPLRAPVREVDQFASAWAASTLAHSNTSADTWSRQPRPSVPSSLTGESGAFPFFHAFISLMKENLLHDSDGVRPASATPASRSVARCSRLAFTRPMWWLYALRAAPACCSSNCSCAAVGSSANLNATSRVSGTPVAERNGSDFAVRRGMGCTVPPGTDKTLICPVRPCLAASGDDHSSGG